MNTTAELTAKANTANATDAPGCKEFATMQARFALRGHELIQSHNPLTRQPDYLVTRWGLSRYCPEWQDVVAFAKQIGAAHE